MRKTLFTAALLSSLAFAAPAGATTVLFDNFDTENGGLTGGNYTGFANWDILPNLIGANPNPNPTVDVVRHGDFGISCVGGTGSCVDLDGGSGNGATLVSKNAFAFNAGDLITISFQLSGNQRGSANDDIQVGSRFVSLTSIDNLFLNSAAGSGGPSALSDTIGFTFFTGNTLNAGQPFGLTTLKYRALTSGAFRARIGTGSDDNFGPVIDNVSLDIAAVPEPASWALMIVGFGLVGSAMRRRKPLTKITFA